MRHVCKCPDKNLSSLNRCFLALVLCFGMGQSTNLYSQAIVGSIESAEGTKWNDICLYQSGTGKLFVSDNTGARILVYDASSLAPLPEIALDSYLPDRPQMLAIHETSGTLFAVVDTGNATSYSKIVVIDADTQAVTDTIIDIGRSLSIDVDESRALLYAFGDKLWVAETLTSIDVNSHAVLGTVDIDDLMSSGIIYYGGLNPVTGELFFNNLHYDQFVIVDGPNLEGEMISATSSSGWEGTWNWLENKLYITTSDWNGYFVYDRDSGASSVAGCVNDGTQLFFNEAMNRVYSGAEIDGESTVIEGSTDACQDVEVDSAHSVVGFVQSMHHAYFAGMDSVIVLDEDTLSTESSFPSCGPCGGGGGAAHSIEVDQDGDRVFVRNYCNTAEGIGSCVMIIDEDAPNYPALSINDVSVEEGDSGTVDAVFTVSLSAAGAEAISVQYATSSDTATANDDYVSVSGTVSFPAGDATPQTITVPVNGYSYPEPNETFFVNLAYPTNATIADDQGIGTITNDDGDPITISIDDVEVTEGDDGATAAVFNVSLSAPVGQTVTVDYTTIDGTATEENLVTVSNSEPITIPSSGAATPYPSTITVDSAPGTVAKVTVTLNGFNHTYPLDVDILLVGPGGQSVILLSDTGGATDVKDATLTFDDDAPTSVPSVITSGTYMPTNGGMSDTFPGPAPEAPYGSTLSVFNGASAEGTWSLYAVDDFSSDDGGISGGWSLNVLLSGEGDYEGTSGELIFGPEVTAQTITVPVYGDIEVEVDETFFVDLSNPTNAVFDVDQGMGTILNDDTASVLDELSADFGTRGLWNYTDAWTKLTSWDPGTLVAWEDKVAVAFGSGRGIWAYDTSGWEKLTSWDPEGIVAWGNKLAADFGATRGLWLYETTGWAKITSWDPEDMFAWGDKLAADFGSGRGLWLYGSSGWTKITTWDPEGVVAWGEKLAADFGADRGLWLYEATVWTKITSWDPEEMVAWGDKLATDFGASRGMWLYGTAWTKITGWDPEEVIVWNDCLVGDFGASGIWMSCGPGPWTKLTSWDPEKMEAMADQLAADFGSSRGLWLYETGWKKITSWDPENMEAVNLN